jgi:hypothetical protein
MCIPQYWGKLLLPDIYFNLLRHIAFKSKNQIHIFIIRIMIID